MRVTSAIDIISWLYSTHKGNEFNTVRDPTISQTSKQLQKRGDRRARQNKRSGSSQSRPTQIASNIMLSHRFRFTSSSATPTSISTASLLCAAGTVAIDVMANTLSSFYESVRVRQVSIYAPAAAQGTFATCSVEWVSTNQGNNQEVSDTSNSVSQPAHISASPPRMSLASFWSSLRNPGALFTIIAPPGSIIDVLVDLILSDDEQGYNFTYTSTATPILGNVYYLSLDNQTSNLYTPVSLTTIV
jgi:hypothetical protein